MAEKMRKWTPGPWTVDGGPMNRIVWSGEDNRVCFMAHSDGRDDERDIATSNLIAAAPDLYEAAEEAQDGITIIDNLIGNIERHGHYSVESTLTFLRQARQHAGMLDAALAKARGES